MATATEQKTLVINEPIKLTIKGALSRGKVFVLFFEGVETPVLLAKSIAAEDGYVHRSQLMGVAVTVTPTQKSNGGLDGMLGEVDLPMANISNNSLLADRQNVANKLAMAKVYATNVLEEN